MAFKYKPYEGSEPYVFVSYCREDAALCERLTEQLAEEGVRLWFDNAIHVGDIWPEVIANHLNGSRLCVLLLTESFVNSVNCRKELVFAIERQVPIAPILVNGTQITFGMQLMLSATQYIRWDGESSSVIDSILASPLAAECLGAAPETVLGKEPENVVVCIYGPPEVLAGEISFAGEQTGSAESEENAGSGESTGTEAGTGENPGEDNGGPAAWWQVPIHELKKTIQNNAGASSKAEKTAEAEKHEPEKPETEAGEENKAEAKAEIKTETKAEKPQTETGAASGRVTPLQGLTISGRGTQKTGGTAAERKQPQTVTISGRSNPARGVTISGRTAPEHFPVLADLTAGRAQFLAEGQHSLRSGSEILSLTLNGSRLNLQCRAGTAYLNGRLMGPGRGAEIPEGASALRYGKTTVLLIGAKAAAGLAGKKNLGILHSAEVGEYVCLTEDSFRLGRAFAWTGGTLNDAFADETHAVVTERGGAFFLTDKGSLNGTWLNRSRLLPETDYELKNGDRIQIGATEIRFSVLPLGM